MFTWLQTVMQKHYKWLFSILLVVIIIAFVFTIGNTGSGGIGAASGKSYRVEFYGYDINPQSRDMEVFGTWTSLSVQLNRDYMSMQNPEMAIKNRIVGLHLADQLKIPEPTQDQLLEYIKGLPAFKNAVNGEFSADQYTTFVDNFKNNPRITEETISTAIAQDYRIAKVTAAITGPGYVLPYQAKRETQRRETNWSVETISLPKSTFEPEFEVDEAALSTYYEANKDNYEIAEKSAIHYVKFSQNASLAEVIETPSAVEMQEHYQANRHKYLKNDEAKTQKTFAEAQVDVILELKKEKAKKLAGQKANEFTIQVYNATYGVDGASKDSPEVQTVLSNHNLTLTDIPPYNSTSIPTALSGLPYKALQEGLSLSKHSFYSSAIETPDGAVVLFYGETIPAAIPPLEEVKEKVTADYKDSEERKLFLEKAKSVKAAIAEAISADTSIEEKAKELGAEFKTYSDFSEVSPPEGLDNTILYSIFDLENGDLSEPLDINDSAVIIHVTKKEVPEISDDDEDLKKSIESLSQSTIQGTKFGILFELAEVASPKTEEDEEQL